MASPMSKICSWHRKEEDVEAVVGEGAGAAVVSRRASWRRRGKSGRLERV